MGIETENNFYPVAGDWQEGRVILWLQPGGATPATPTVTTGQIWPRGNPT